MTRVTNVKRCKSSHLLLGAALALCASAGAGDARPAGAELEAKLPEVFAKSAAHYRALDAAATPQMTAVEDGKTVHLIPHGWRKWKTGRDELDMRGIYGWTSGHFPGSLWYLYEATGDDFFKTRATVWTELLAPVSKYTGNHDTGFMMYCSYGNARRLLKTDKYDALLVETANSLCQRYDEKLGLIRSWGKIGDEKDFLVIPDNLMNLELLEFAAEGPRSGVAAVALERDPPRSPEDFDRIARSHADITMAHHFRPDGGCRHVLNYDRATGRVKEIRRGQGASCETAWSRGQSWAIYGYTMMYRATGYIRYLDFAKKLADWAINHPNMPADGIPYWDYGAPGEERDSSAGSIMASALVELSQYVGAADRDRYRAFAVKQLLALASPAYFSEGNEIGHFLLKHGVGHKPGGSEIDTALDYGDYYFLEALVRFRKLRAREKAAAARVASLCGADGIRVLPAKAALPEDELAVRIYTPLSNVTAVAEKALLNPIPDTSDELYWEFMKNGNRSRYEKPYFQRLHNLGAMAMAEKREGKGRYLPRIEEYIAVICDMKAWTVPAHDNTDGGNGTFRGVWIMTDLFSTEIAAQLACVVQALGPDGALGDHPLPAGRPTLKPETVARIKAEVERRVFSPVRRETPTVLHPETVAGPARVTHLWWIRGANNWNSVCWDNVVCAAMGLVDDPADRLQFVAGADMGADTYLEKGFEPDGYCSEGMGYWNYGYGHHLKTGRLLNRLTQGRLNWFHRLRQRLAAAYPRAYTLCAGVSPAFADGNGAVDPKFQAMVDEFWPDLPKTTPAASEFPDGQVWLLRDPDGLSVAFKGGHNQEHHNHNDLGSYYLIDGTRFVAGDPGGEEYTRRTFSSRRYESQVINSYGHPVPVVGGQLQSYGRQFAAKVLEKKVKVGGEGEQRSLVTLDLTNGYDVKTLKTLTRTFVYDRAAKTFAVKDHVEFTEPTAFEDCYITFGDEVKVKVEGDGQRSEVSGQTKVKMLAKPVELIENPHRKTPHRFAWTFEKPVMEADVEFLFRH